MFIELPVYYCSRPTFEFESGLATIGLIHTLFPSLHCISKFKNAWNNHRNSHSIRLSADSSTALWLEFRHLTQWMGYYCQLIALSILQALATILTILYNGDIRSAIVNVDSGAPDLLVLACFAKNYSRILVEAWWIFSLIAAKQRITITVSRNLYWNDPYMVLLIFYLAGKSRKFSNIIIIMTFQG